MLEVEKMKGNKNTHGRRNFIRGLLVMVVIVIVMLGWNAGESVDSWMNRSLQSASAESVSVKNNLPLVAMQEFPPKAESIVTASPEVKLNSVRHKYPRCQQHIRQSQPQRKLQKQSILHLTTDRVTIPSTFLKFYSSKV